MSIQAVSKDNFNLTRSAVAAPGQLNITIIGAGLVGLAAAAMLRKQGHRITIFESSSFYAEIGAGIVLTPNGVEVIKKLLPELKWENMQPVDLRSIEMFSADGTHLTTSDLSEAWKTYPQGWLQIHRVDLHKELMRLALDSDADAKFPPAVVRLGTPIKAVDFNSRNPSVTTSSGEAFECDLILGSDGIKSTVRKCMVGPEYDAAADHVAFYRWTIDLKKNPELSWIRDQRTTSGPTLVMGKSIGLFMYPIRGGNLINISGAHQDKRDQDTIDWNAEADMKVFQEAFEDFGNKFMPTVSVAESPRVWQVRKLPTLSTWVKGNVALLGDAAHAMFPTLGQGFAMGLEDAATIATLFPSGTKPSEVSVRLEAYQEIRKPRAEHVSQLSTDGMKLDSGFEQTSDGPDDAEAPPDEAMPGIESMWVIPHLLEYDPVGLAKAALAKI